MTSGADLLYVHSVFHQVPTILPMGVIGLMNHVNCSKLGLYSYEVTTEHLKTSQILAMDLHWYMTLWPVCRLAEFYKSINPELKIIIGGYTAALFAEHLVQDFEIDFVVRGDTEEPFRMLVEALLDGRDQGDIDIPNITSKDFSTPLDYQIDVEMFSRMDYHTRDWFPEYVRKTELSQGESIHTLDLDLGNYPFVPINRGCPYSCEFCYGNRENTRALFGRPPIVRRAGSVVRDLSHLSDDPRVPGVCFVSDFFDLCDHKYAEQVLARSYDLNLYYEFYNLPEIDDVKRLSECFRQSWLSFALYREHGESDKMVDIEQLHNILESLRGQRDIRVSLFNPRSYYRFPMVLSRRRVAKVVSNEGWHVGVPRVTEIGAGQKGEYHSFLDGSHRDFWNVPKTDIMVAISGIHPPEDRRADTVMPRLEEIENQRRFRGCFPRSLVIDQSLSSSESEDQRREIRRWMDLFVDRNTVIVTLDSASQCENTCSLDEPCHQASGIDANYGRGSLDYTSNGQLNLGMKLDISRASHSSELIEGPSRMSQEALDLRILSVDQLLAGKSRPISLNEARNQGAWAGQLWRDTCVLDACRWLSGTTCPARGLERVWIDRDGAIRTCSQGTIVGVVGDSNQTILERVMDDWETARQQRGCLDCSVRDLCPQCIYLGSVPAEQYCTIMRDGAVISDLLLLPQILREYMLLGTVNEPARVPVELELTPRRALLQRIAGEVAQRGGPRLKASVRLVRLGQRFYLCDIDTRQMTAISEDVLHVLAAMHHDDLLPFMAHVVNSGRAPTISSVCQVAVGLQDYLEL